MAEPMPDARLAEIRELLAGWTWHCGHREPEKVVRELLAEVDRLRALEVPAGFLVTPIEATPQQIAEWQAAWDEPWASGIVVYDLPAPQPPGPMWEPLRDKPRSRDYPVGG